MIEFIKKNLFISLIFIITLSLGFLTFLTFIDKSFIKLSDANLQILLIVNIFFLLIFFIIIFLYSFFAIADYIKKNENKDPKEVVIDEVIGQTIPIYLY